MRLRTLLLSCLLLLYGALTAQGITITGQVTYGTTDRPLPDHPVWLGAGGQVIAKTLTDSTGTYFLHPPATTNNRLWVVYTDDPCRNAPRMDTVLINPNQAVYRISFRVCPEINPPPPPPGCEAVFHWEQDFNNRDSLVIRFYNLSYSSSPIRVLEWEFGDGEDLRVETPQSTTFEHVYAEPGMYEVVLGFVNMEGCDDSFSTTIKVVDLNQCDCPTDEYDPVCVKTPAGNVLTFSQPCLAECAGYDPEEYFDCNCNCPEYYQPVCVITETGDTLKFDNRCFAQCEGFGPDEWFFCGPLSGCACASPLGRVCVQTPNGTISFPNPCVAREFGYGQNDIVPCDCNCPEDWFAPVCVIAANGDTLQFANPCRAECAGFAAGDWFSCGTNNNCPCPRIWDPVCVMGPDSAIITFANACLARCAGFGPGMYFECDGNCICPAIFAPVCVIGPDGQLIKFENACRAECAGYGPEDIVDCDNACPCTAEFHPVCVIGPDNRIITFGNPCRARCAGYGPDDFVPCTTTGNCGCTDELDPVCVYLDNGEVRRFRNRCLAKCAGYGEEDIRRCENNNCGCSEEEAPVCVRGENGQLIRFRNICLAECAGFSGADVVPCNNDCVCTFEFDPVCVIDSTGSIRRFQNACFAKCAGFGEDSFVPCENTCGCTDEFAPVCVIDTIGSIRRFQNACLAKCAGYGEDSFVPCANTCPCDTVWDPVCVLDDTGSIRRFGNPCEARCAGYGPDDFIPCDGDCHCPTDVYAPVCADTDCGPIIFPNRCVARCHGFGDDQLRVCERDSSLCRADFRVQVFDDNRLMVHFMDESQSQLPIQRWLWDFGDGQRSDEPSPTHTYAEPGVYTVTLYIRASDCESKTSREVVISRDGGTQTDCQAVFFFKQRSDNRLSFQFQDLSLGRPTLWHWEFGDGTTSTEQHPDHTYSQPGIYLVTLTIGNDRCFSTARMLLTIGRDVMYGDSCQALFLPLIDPDSLTVYFVNLSSPNSTDFRWDFGDGNVAETPLAFHRYAEAGSYTVTLTITTDDGCTSTYSVNLNLMENNFTGNPSYSLVNATHDASETLRVRLQPNPTSNIASLQFELARGGSYSLELIDGAGRRLRQWRADGGAGLQDVPVDVSDQAAGLYYLRLRTPEGVKVLRLVKQ